MGAELEAVDEVVAVDGVDAGGRLGDDDDIGAPTCGAEFAEIAERENMVFEIGVAIFGEEDVDGGL